MIRFIVEVHKMRMWLFYFYYWNVLIIDPTLYSGLGSGMSDNAEILKSLNMDLLYFIPKDRGSS